MSETLETLLDAKTRRSVGKALGCIPQGMYVLTASYERRVRAVLVSWVQQVSFEPPMIAVALSKGRSIVPLIHESHCFALNQIAQEDKLAMKTFMGNGRGRPRNGKSDSSPLDAMEVVRKVTGAPVLTRAQAYFDCELVRHLDFDADHDLYIGAIRDGAILNGGNVTVRLREDGMKY